MSLDSDVNNAKPSLNAPSRSFYKSGLEDPFQLPEMTQKSSAQVSVSINSFDELSRNIGEH